MNVTVVLPAIGKKLAQLAHIAAPGVLFPYLAQNLTQRGEAHGNLWLSLGSVWRSSRSESCHA